MRSRRRWSTPNWAAGLGRRAGQRHASKEFPVGRFARPEEIAGLILYLASDASAMLTRGKHSDRRRLHRQMVTRQVDRPSGRGHAGSGLPCPQGLPPWQPADSPSRHRRGGDQDRRLRHLRQRLQMPCGRRPLLGRRAEQAGLCQAAGDPGPWFFGPCGGTQPDQGEHHGVAIGDHVIAEQIVPCGRCRYCKTGIRWMCEVHDVLLRLPGRCRRRHGRLHAGCRGAPSCTRSLPTSDSRTPRSPSRCPARSTR